jgi:hypothetical protein
VISGVPIELVASPEPLAAGRYTRRDFEPALTFEVAGGEWTAVQVFDGFFDIQQLVGTPDVIALQFARPVALFGTHGVEVPLSEAAIAPAILRGNPALAVLEASAVSLAGLSGAGVTVDYAGRVDGFAPVLRVPPGPISILPGRRLWIGFFDTRPGVLAIMVGGSISGFAAAVTAAQPVMGSLEIEA